MHRRGVGTCCRMQWRKGDQDNSTACHAHFNSHDVSSSTHKPTCHSGCFLQYKDFRESSEHICPLFTVIYPCRHLNAHFIFSAKSITLLSTLLSKNSCFLCSVFFPRLYSCTLILPICLFFCSFIYSFSYFLFSKDQNMKVNVYFFNCITLAEFAKRETVKCL